MYGKRNNGTMKEVLLDIENNEILTKRSWCISSLGYVVGRNKETNKVEYLHRIIMGNPKGLCVDHINGNKLDNRKCNLRVCSKGDNLRNTFKRNGEYSSAYKGVHFDKQRKKWKAGLS